MNIANQMISQSHSFSSDDLDNFIVSMKGLNTFLIGLESGILNIFDADLAEAPKVLDLGNELGYFGIHGAAFKEGTVLVSLSTYTTSAKLVILSLDYLCHESCPGKCIEQPLTDGTDNKCLSCPPNYFKNSINGCEIQCPAGSNPNSKYTACIACDTCCPTCHFNSVPNAFPTYPEVPNIENLVCPTLLEGYTYTRGVCNKIPGFFGPTLTPSEDKTEVEIQFWNEPHEFTLENIILTTNSTWVNHTDYHLTLEKDINNQTLYILKINYLNQDYDEDITLFVSNVKWTNLGELKTFPQSRTQFKLLKKVESKLHPLRNGTQGSINKMSHFTASYGVFFASILPSLSNIAITLHIIKIIPFFPTILPQSIKDSLKKFFTLVERDVLSNLYNDKVLFSTQYKRAKELKPIDLDYSIVSIYPRIQGLKTVTRLILNITFLFLLVKLRKQKLIKLDQLKTKGEELPGKKNKKKTPSGIRRLYFKYIIRAIVSFNYINITENFVVIATSANNRLSFIEFFTIVLDVSVICLFTTNLVAFYVKYKGLKSIDIKDKMERQIIASAFFQQKGIELTLPFSLLKNIFDISRILILFLFLRYEIAFGVIFLCLNMTLVTVSVVYYVQYKKLYIWSFGLFMLGEMFESAVFILLSLYCVNFYNVKSNTFYHSLISIFILL